MRTASPGWWGILPSPCGTEGAASCSARGSARRPPAVLCTDIARVRVRLHGESGLARPGRANRDQRGAHRGLPAERPECHDSRSWTPRPFFTRRCFDCWGATRSRCQPRVSPCAGRSGSNRAKPCASARRRSTPRRCCATFSEAVRCRMRGTCVASTLSGGLDSSAVVAVARKQRLEVGGSPLLTVLSRRRQPALGARRRVRTGRGRPAGHRCPLCGARGHAPG